MFQQQGFTAKTTPFFFCATSHYHCEYAVLREAVVLVFSRGLQESRVFHQIKKCVALYLKACMEKSSTGTQEQQRETKDSQKVPWRV